jgi:hypothetical protein
MMVRMQVAGTDITMTRDQPVRWWTPLVVVVAGAVAGAAVGVAINQVNVAVSPNYFISVVGASRQAPWVKALWHGAVEGGVLGTVFGLVLATTAAGCGARRRCRCSSWRTSWSPPCS